jgi:magnesium chelatase family protein
MLARAHTFTIEGLHTRHVTVEVDVRPGLPGFAIVGLADAAVREARERIQAAILNSGYQFPAKRITANLAPGDVRKAGPGLDLALACAVLAASGQLPPQGLERVALFGELALDGAVRPSRGTLAVAQATRRAGVSTLALAGARAREATLIDGLQVTVVEHLRSAVRVLSGGRGDALPELAGAHAGERSETGKRTPSAAAPGPDLSEVRGQHHAVQSLVIAAGTQALRMSRPFRAPHHSITAAGLVGGASRGWVGEVVLAHNGVLFLDELSEFSRPALEALRQPLEDGRVAIARARHSAVYPARFMLVAATNPCPCGYAGEEDHCRCTEADMARHRRRLSGPLLDRIDLLANLQRELTHDLRAPALMSSEQARERVASARERQAARLAAEAVAVNAHMDARMLALHVRLSARGEHRVLRVARTIADLDASKRVRARDLGAALALRPDVTLTGSRAI